MFCSLKSIVNMQNEDNFCSLWCVLAHLHEVDIHRERVSQHEIFFQKPRQGDLQFSMNIKDLLTFEHLNNLKINVSELSSNEKFLLPKYNNKNYYDEQIDLLLCANHVCLTFNLHNICTKR